MDKDMALQIFDGVMLGDGGLYRALRAGDPPPLCYRVKESRFSITQSTEAYDHMDWLYSLKKAFVELRVEVSSGYPKYTKCRSRGKVFGSSKLLTLCSPWLTEQRKRWYPKGIKEVPGDCLFTPISLANMWMGDGGASRDPRGIAVNTHFSTQGFSLSSVEAIEAALRDLGIHTGRGTEDRGISGIAITVLQRSVDTFMDIIDHWVTPSFKYKVKYRLKPDVGVERAAELLIRA